jgi:hypothetical protein
VIAARRGQVILMTDYWINPKQEALGIVAISEEEMSLHYQVSDRQKKEFREAMADGLSLQDAKFGGHCDIFPLSAIVSVPLSRMTCCLQLDLLQWRKSRQHYLYVWDRDTFDKVVGVLRARLGPTWEIRKGKANAARTWMHSWPIWLLLLMFTVIGFFAVRQWEAERAIADSSIASLGFLISGIVLMALYALWLIYRTTVPNQDQLVPVAKNAVR